jgi:hypothetical protein
MDTDSMAAESDMEIVGVGIGRVEVEVGLEFVGGGGSSCCLVDGFGWLG